ncbi:MAG TPA: hypothetical protein VFT48_17310 [Pyrinomonadaceae bacterium]|nr:hypothetical protein [Pyrinomonadaceae bacterium]
MEDGTPLAADAPAVDPNATIRYPSARDTEEPPPTEIYQPPPPVVSPRQTAPPPPPPPRTQPPPQWTPAPAIAAPPRKKSNVVWWILGGVAALFVIGIGLVVMIIALASLNSNNINNSNVTNRNDNRNSNVTVNANVSNTNANSNASLPTSLDDDFSQQKWGVGSGQYGRIWYEGGEYHMQSKAGTFVVMYAPSDDYSTENATVKVTARSVDGDVPSSGFGLLVHCAQSKAKQLEDYGLLIYPGDEPEYEIVKHKNGTQSPVVTKTKSSAIQSGSTPNVLEVRIRGTELSFYANGQFLTRITDNENFKHGKAGLYTSDIHEVVFDDLSIKR